ncbi:MAG: hypothetical protein ACRYGP_03795 [Janthinobacterium lividum]
MLVITQLNRDLMRMMKQVRLGPFERDLIERTLIEAVRNGAGCTIEQVVTLPGQTSGHRLRVQVAILRNAADAIDQLHLTFEAGGQPIIDWTWPGLQSRSAGGPAGTALLDHDTELVDSVSAIILFSATIDRVARGASPIGKIADYCAGIDCNARRILSRGAPAMS